jgi:hypothetical protein
LPDGLNLDTSTGEISGAPTASGTSWFAIEVTDAGALTVTATFSVTVAGKASMTAASLSPTITISGQSVDYSASVTGAGNPTGSITFDVGSTSLCTSSLSAGSGSCTASNAPVGADIVTASYSGDSTFASSTDTMPLTVDETPTITAQAPPLAGVTGQNYQYTFAGSGFPSPTFALTGAPAWLSINGTSGVVTGTPPAGTTSFSYSVVASSGISPDVTVGPFTVSVTSAPDFTSDSAPTSASVGHAYSYTFAASGNPPPTYSLVRAPAWLSINPRSGQVSGTPPGATTSFSYSVDASNGTLPNATTGPFTVSVTTPVTAGSLAPSIVGMAATPDGGGYWLADAAGGVSPHGDALSYGSMAGHTLNSPIAHIVASPDGKGYWLVAADGGVFAFGDAAFFGSMGGRPLNAPVVDLAPTRDGNGYWLVAADGGIFAFGDAAFHGSMGGRPLNKPVVGIAPDVSTGGYWEVATDGGIFAFGALFCGSTGNLSLNKPVNGMTATPDDQGYWFVASDGGIFAFGDAGFHGSAGSLTLNAPIVGMAAADSTGGYWLVASDGGIFAYGAPYYGSD